MKMFHVKRQLLALFMPGFLLGILYVNLEAEQFAAGAGIFSEYFLKQYRAADKTTVEYYAPENSKVQIFYRHDDKEEYQSEEKRLF